jgi:hypothetical protein
MTQRSGRSASSLAVGDADFYALERDKDRKFAPALVDASLIDCDVLRDRASTLETVGGIRRRVSETVTGIEKNRQPRT